MSLGQIEAWYLTIGGEIRECFEFVDHRGWGKDPDDSKYLLQRYMLHTDVHLA